ncbi:hypothetical protein ABPG72_022689 [Tetrahymena utriculariae]
MSMITIMTIFGYSVYLFQLQFSNQINPKYSSQSFVTEDKIDVNLNEGLVGFRYENSINLNLDDLQNQNNKNYLCSSNYLQGVNCFDFQQIQNNYTLTLSRKDNIASFTILFVYKYKEINSLKTQVPSNCASDIEIGNLIYNPYASLRLKLFASQIYTTSLQNQINYRNSALYLSQNQFSFYSYKTQKQITTLKNGYLFQQKQEHTLPIQYSQVSMLSNRQQFQQAIGQAEIAELAIQMDEIIQQIQYSTQQLQKYQLNVITNQLFQCVVEFQQELLHKR